MSSARTIADVLSGRPLPRATAPRGRRLDARRCRGRAGGSRSRRTPGATDTRPARSCETPGPAPDDLTDDPSRPQHPRAARADELEHRRAVAAVRLLAGRALVGLGRLRFEPEQVQHHDGLVVGAGQQRLHLGRRRVEFDGHGNLRCAGGAKCRPARARAELRFANVAWSVTSFEAWSRLRTVQRLGPERARAAVERAVTELVRGVSRPSRSDARARRDRPLQNVPPTSTPYSVSGPWSSAKKRTATGSTTRSVKIAPSADPAKSSARSPSEKPDETVESWISTASPGIVPRNVPTMKRWSWVNWSAMSVAAIPHPTPAAKC